MAWVLRRPDVGDWGPQLQQMTTAALTLGFAEAWQSGIMLRPSPEEMTALFWQVDTGNGDWTLFAVGRAKDGKAFGSIGLASMLVEDVLLRVWGNQLFDGKGEQGGGK
jgi:hypothetical protein